MQAFRSNSEIGPLGSVPFMAAKVPTSMENSYATSGAASCSSFSVLNSSRASSFKAAAVGRRHEPGADSAPRVAQIAAHAICCLGKDGVPKGIRTPVAAVKGRCPRPG
jgi:hypothetical protein